jgi:hypothetical protein
MKGGEEKMNKVMESIHLLLDVIQALRDGIITPEELEKIETDIKIIINMNKKE